MFVCSFDKNKRLMHHEPHNKNNLVFLYCISLLFLYLTKIINIEIEKWKNVECARYYCKTKNKIIKSKIKIINIVKIRRENENWGLSFQ